MQHLERRHAHGADVERHALLVLDEFHLKLPLDLRRLGKQRLGGGGETVRDPAGPAMVNGAVRPVT